MLTGIQLAFGEASDPGLDPSKRVNEDAVGELQTPLGHVFVVCDGMGGHAGGKQASALAVRTVFEVFQAASPEGSGRATLKHSIEEAARRVYRMGGPAGNKQRPGSTCVAMLIADGKVEVAHVGDSRAYMLRGGQLIPLTRDHSLVQEMVDNGMLSPQAAIGHPQANKITRGLGMHPEAEVELRPEPVVAQNGDVFLLASDGLTDMVRDHDIQLTISSYLKAQSVSEVCRELVALANRRGGHDNITVQLVHVAAGASERHVTKLQAPRGRDPHAAEGHLQGAPGPTQVQGPRSPAVPTAPTSGSGEDLSVTEPGRPAATQLQGPKTQVREPPAHEQLGHQASPPQAAYNLHSPPTAAADNRALEAQVSRLTTMVTLLAAFLALTVGLLVWALVTR